MNLIFQWLSLPLVVAVMLGIIYLEHRQIVNAEKQLALQQYNINQLQQSLKDKDAYLAQMEEISKHKSEIVAQLYIAKDRLEEKLKDIQSHIDREVGAGHDRRSSKILKDTFKALGEMK